MVFCPKQVQNRLLIFNTSSERPFSKLSENHKINVIGPTERKLWPFKDALLTLGQYIQTVFESSIKSPHFCIIIACPCMHSSEVDWSVFVGLFDVNQWYHSQMPRCIRWKAKGKYTG